MMKSYKHQSILVQNMQLSANKLNMKRNFYFQLGWREASCAQEMPSQADSSWMFLEEGVAECCQVKIRHHDRFLIKALQQSISLGVWTLMQQLRSL